MGPLASPPTWHVDQPRLVIAIANNSYNCASNRRICDSFTRKTEWIRTVIRYMNIKNRETIKIVQ